MAAAQSALSCEVAFASRHGCNAKTSHSSKSTSSTFVSSVSVSKLKSAFLGVYYPDIGVKSH